ncbi:MAG: 50S ribosomal protein L21 [Candidatus Muproteobacteria bacterium RBG_16_60_9]|jgi:large subunit ribosomal protein L21|uniref:Large ribosomal subunit protein bL21 n=1 Tax=Candidatus Muproteobacteria bacterium RBG_16_60_9 TaxID=1817755 RepID=A0A1F6UVM3_9PROT|nr:MAG: 50S ribosomal protein L21 [Candidatus Muproteobacteria bacterium RBG_16_60_9]
MYAVIESGGKQYRVAPGDVIRVERLDVAAGETVDLDRILLVADNDGPRMGSPMLSGVSVTAKVRAHGRGEKIRIFKMRRRKGYRRQAGHRQNYTELEITQVAGVSAPIAAPAAGNG